MPTNYWRGAMIVYLFDMAVLNRSWDAALYLVDEAWAKDKGRTLLMLSKALLIASRIFLPMSFRALLYTTISSS
jgi:hypothetical protein